MGHVIYCWNQLDLSDMMGERKIEKFELFVFSYRTAMSGGVPKYRQLWKGVELRNLFQRIRTQRGR